MERNWSNNDKRLANYFQKKKPDPPSVQEELKGIDSRYLGALHVLEPNVIIPAQTSTIEINAFGNDEAADLPGLHHAVIDAQSLKGFPTGWEGKKIPKDWKFDIVDVENVSTFCYC